MTEIEYVLLNFDRHFHEHIGKKIIIHGTREYAAAIIEQFDSQYHFTAIMTCDEITSQVFHGKPVLDLSQLEGNTADLIILTERVRHERKAWEQIRDKCQECGIQILDMYGLDIAKVYEEYQVQGYRPFRLDRTAVLRHQIVIFETVDGFFYTKDGKLTMEPRMFEVAKYAMSQNREVFFSLRKSYPESEQIAALMENGLIENADAPALIRRKGEDFSLRRFLDAHPGKKVIYYADGFGNEFLMPRYYGIDTCRVTHFQEVEFYPALDHIKYTSAALDKNVNEQTPSLEQLLDEYDVISFDIFDTLIMRKVPYPEDVLHVMRQRLADSGYDSPDRFIEERKRVERDLSDADFSGFYDELRKRLNLSPEQREALFQLELALENELIIPRDRVVELFEQAKQKGKTVVLTSDMYLSSNLLSEILNNHGISGWDEILVSCEYHTDKAGNLFGELRQKYPNKKIIHFGDNPQADIHPAEARGIQAILVPSAYQLAVQGGLEDFIAQAKNPDERNMVGLILSRLFNDPFLPYAYKGLDLPSRMKRFALVACMPLILGYLFWLENKLKEEHFDKMLFLSRDGWVLTELYAAIRGKGKYTLPEGIYFYSNRHSAFQLCADDSSLLPAVIEIFPKTKTAKEMFSSLFGMEPIPDSGMLPEMFEQNIDRINNLGKAQRASFEKYLEREGITRTGRYAVMDFVSSGKTVDFLALGTGLDLYGFSFALRPSPYDSKLPMPTYLDGITDKFIIHYFMEMEYIMTSPEAALDHFDEEGNPVFAEEIRGEEEIQKILFIQDWIKKTALEYIHHFYHDGITIDPELTAIAYAADGIHGIMKGAYDDWGKYKLM